MRKLTCALALIASAIVVLPSEASVVPVESDFFTTAWAFGAPYVRDAGRDSIGVTSPNPFQFDTGPDNVWEETTYFTFDFNPAEYSTPVSSALLQVETVLRASGSYPTPTEAFSISAHRVLDDPTTIDPNLNSGPGSYVEFKNNKIGAVEDTVALNSEGVFSWDVTDLVNEWIANGDANFDYSIAMTGRVGNPADTDSTGAFHAFVNQEGGLGGVNAQIVIPEPATLASLALGALALLGRGRRTK